MADHSAFTKPLSFTVTVSDEDTRTFTQKQITAGVVAWSSRVEALYRRSDEFEERATERLREIRDAEKLGVEGDALPPVDPGIQINDIAMWMMRDERLLNDFMRVIYDGNHNGINWYEQEGVSVYLMLVHFMMRTFERARTKSSASQTSSAASDINSSRDKTSSPAKASTSGGSKKRSGSSRKARKTTNS